MKKTLLALAIVLFAACATMADAVMDAAIAKARTATGKTTVKLPLMTNDDLDRSGPLREGRNRHQFGDNPARPTSTTNAKGIVFKASPGYHEDVSLSQDNCIIDGYLEPDKLAPPYIRNIKVDAENCVIRGITCKRLILRNGAKATVVDSVIGCVSFENPGRGDEAKKSKCDLLAANCSIFRLWLSGPKSYVVHYVNRNTGERHDENVNVSNNKCQFKFKNCSFLLTRPLETYGMTSVEFSKCVFSQTSPPYKIDREFDGRCALEFEDCAIYQKDAPEKQLNDTTGAFFSQYVRQQAGKCITKGKMIFLPESPFPYENGGSDAKIGSLNNMTIEESSVLGKLGLGALIGNAGMPAASKAAAKAQPAQKKKVDGSAKTEDSLSDDALDRELEEAAKKLEDATKK